MSGAGWYDDPRRAADLRWYDGVTWTDHVATAGRAWTSPLDEVPDRPDPGASGGAVRSAPAALLGGRDVLTAGTFLVARTAQPRGDGSSLEVYDDAGPLGRFVESEPDELVGSAVVRLLTPAGAPVLSITHPGGSGRAKVDGPTGSLGFVSRVGRVRANLEVHGPGRRPEGEPLLVLRPLEDRGGWLARGVEVRTWPLGQPSAPAYAEARYEVTIGDGVPATVRPLLVALPVLVDRSITQVP
jgi:hypothetical protein